MELSAGSLATWPDSPLRNLAEDHFGNHRSSAENNFANKGSVDRLGPANDGTPDEPGGSQPSTSSVLGFLGGALNLAGTWLSSSKAITLMVLGGLLTYFAVLGISVIATRMRSGDRNAAAPSKPAIAASAQVRCYRLPMARFASRDQAGRRTACWHFAPGVGHRGTPVFRRRTRVRRRSCRFCVPVGSTNRVAARSALGPSRTAPSDSPSAPPRLKLSTWARNSVSRSRGRAIPKST